MQGKASSSILQAGALGTLITASTYGRPIPIIYGTTRSPLLVIWAANLRVAGSKGGGGKKGQKKGVPTYAENVDFLVGSNPIMAPLQVWCNTNSYYPLTPKKYVGSTYAGTSPVTSITVPDASLYAVIAVTATVAYSETFNDYGGPGPVSVSGNFEVPLWNAAFNGPDPCSTQAFKYFPYVYFWLPGTSTIQIPYFAPGFIDIPINIYYAAIDANSLAYAKSNTGSKNTSEIPISALQLSWETELGQGTEYDGFSSQQIIYPWFAGLGSPNIDLGASGALPNINVEMLGSFAVYPDTSLETMGGDADFSDMITDIFASGPAQGGYDGANQSSGALGLTSVQHGLNCNDFPGIVQHKMWYSSNFTEAPVGIPYDAQVTEGDFLVVFYRNDTAGTPPTGVSDTQGNTWTNFLAETPATNVNVYGWWAQANATGKNAITVEGSGEYHQQLEMFDIAGFDTMDTNVVATGSNSVPQLQITSSTKRTQPGQLLAWWNIEQAGYLGVAAPRWTIVTGLNTNPNIPAYGAFSEQRKVWGPATVPDVHVATNDWWVGAAIAFKNTNVPQYPISLGRILEPTTLANAALGARAGGLWGSLNLNSARKASDILTDLCSSMNAAAVYTGGQLKIISWSEVSAAANGAIFIAPTASGPVANLGPSDFVGDASTSPGQVGRKAEVDAPPILSMQIFDRGNNYNPSVVTQPDPAGAALFGVRKAAPMKRDEIQSAVVAESLLGIAARRQVYVRNTYKYKLNMNWVLLEPMDLVTLTDPQIGLNAVPMRIRSVEEDKDHNLDVEFEPFQYGLNAPQTPTVTPVSPYRPPYGADPGSVNTPIFIEAVPQLALASNTEELLIVLSSANANYGGAVIYVSTDGGNSYQTSSDTSNPWRTLGSAVTGVTVGDWAAHADPDMANNLTVDLSESNGQLLNYTAPQRDTFTYAVYLEGGNASIPYEICSYNAAELTGTDKFTIEATGTGNAIRRGVFGAPSPGQGADHPNGSRFAFLGNPAQGQVPGIFQLPVQPAWIGVTIYFKFQAFNQFGAAAQSLADCTPYTFTPSGTPGSVNPIGIAVPPVNFLVNGE